MGVNGMKLGENLTRAARIGALRGARWYRSGIVPSLLFSLVVSFMVGPASAQDLSGEVERLRRDLIDLQRFVYAGKAPSSATQATGTSGAASGGVSPELAGQMQVKLQKIERRIRELNGRFEEIDFRIRQLTDTLERQSSDQELRFQRIEQAMGIGAAGTGVPSSGLTSGLSTGQAAGGVQSLTPSQSVGTTAEGDAVLPEGTTIVSSAGTSVQSDDAVLQPGQQALGTLRTDADGNVVGADLAPQAAPSAAQSQPATAPQPQAAPQAAPVTGDVGGEAVASTGPVTLPEGSAKDRYDFALTLLRKRDYPGAESALRQFVDAHGGDPLAGAAMYWLGETYYVRENYRDAAAVFVDTFSNYPNSNKAPDSLLKLGMSLGALGKTDAACTAFATLREKYPSARARVLRTAEAQGTRFGCG